MLKILINLALISLVIYLIYIKFFKKPKNMSNEPDAMVACDSCGIFIEQKDSIKQNNKIYCCETCAQKGVKR
jgi:uncharacterized protein